MNIYSLAQEVQTSLAGKAFKCSSIEEVADRFTENQLSLSSHINRRTYSSPIRNWWLVFVFKRWQYKERIKFSPQWERKMLRRTFQIFPKTWPSFKFCPACLYSSRSDWSSNLPLLKGAIDYLLQEGVVKGPANGEFLNYSPSGNGGLEPVATKEL